MHDLLNSLGWADAWINIVEISLYVILILSGLIAIVKQTIKTINKIVPRFKEMKTLKHKLRAIGVFYRWYCKAVEDGHIDDEEISIINLQFDNIINGSYRSKDGKFNNQCVQASTDLNKAAALVDTSKLDTDGCDD